jgi:hypothetical protein
MVSWQQTDRPWTELDIPCDNTDGALFDVSTIVTVGKGDKASFWHSHWINGQAPKNLAPNLFQKAKRKKITVLEAMENNRWVSHIFPICTTEELREFFNLWEEMGTVVREVESDDKIKWRWTIDGQYTTQSAYQIQFTG